MRLWGLIGTSVLLTVSALPGATVAAEPVPLSIVYNNLVYGDVAMAGNSVVVCPAAQACVDAQNRVGLPGPAAQNNYYIMQWADVDDDPGTFNSSSGRLAIPPGARIDHATLSWEGAVGGQCAQGSRPPGSPRTQPVSVTVNGRTSRLLPDRFTADTQFYSARAELTGVLRGAAGAVTVTVGNVWTPQGFDCAGGWSVVAVWAFDGPHPRAGPAQITVYDTHLRVTGGNFGVSVRVPSLRPSGGGARIGVIAYEGDWALAGDRFLVNGRDPDHTGNFFASFAEGRLDPSYPNNMSVDVRSVSVPEDALGPSTELTFSSGLDTYLVQGIVVAIPVAELAVATEVDRPAAHTGDEVVQTVRVTNAGGAPAVRMVVRTDAGCVREIARLDGGKTATVRCDRTASERLSARVTGETLLGDPLIAEANTAVEVLRPGISVSVKALPEIVLKGQSVGREIAVRNTGNTALSDVVVDAQVDACDRADPAPLPAGETWTVRCSAPAEAGGGRVTVAGFDKLGLRVSAEALATVTVVVPRLTLTVSPSTRAVRAGGSVTFRINVNSETPLPLEAVRVIGAPAECARDLGTLAPNQNVSYACTVVVQDRLTTNLSVTAGDALAGGVTVRASATVIVSIVPENPPPLPPAARRVALEQTPEPAPLAALIGGLAVLSNLVMVGGFAATACRPK